MLDPINATRRPMVPRLIDETRLAPGGWRRSRPIGREWDERHAAIQLAPPARLDRSYAGGAVGALSSPNPIANVLSASAPCEDQSCSVATGACSRLDRFAIERLSMRGEEFAERAAGQAARQFESA